MKLLVLIIDDDLAFREALRDDLLSVGFYAFIANAGNAMSQALQRLKPDVLLISADLDDESAFSQVSRLRQDAQTGKLPIIMYSASAQLIDKARGLEVGADDFVSKPFQVEALLTRIHGLLRYGTKDENDDIVEVGGLRVDVSGHNVAYESKSVELSRTMFNVLCLMVRQPDRVFTREQIRDAIWGEAACISTRSVDVFMNRLRQNLGQDAREMIKTVRGIGYKISASAPMQSELPSHKNYRRASRKRFLLPTVGSAAHAL